MNLLDKLFKGNKLQDENYLALVITPDRTLATIWTFDGDRVKTLGFGHKSYDDQDVLIHQAAIAIDSAGQQAKVDITKTVFGLADFYLSDGSLKKDTAKTLKRLSSELELDPQAFVPISSGINHMLKVEESVTPHAVLAGVFKNHLEVHLLENGKVTKSKSSQSQASPELFKNLISSLKEQDQSLPSRIVVFGIGESSELAEKLIKGNWQEIFTTDPKIDFLDDTELSRSTAYAQAADILGYDPIIRNDSEITRDEPKHHANELGFVEGEDILLRQKADIETAKPKDKEKKDIEEVAPEQTREESKKKEEYTVNPSDQQDLIEPPNPKKAKNLPSVPNPLALLSGLRLLKFPAKLSPKKIAVAFVIVTLILVSIAYVYGQTIASAQVVILVNGKELEKDFKARIVQGSSYSADNAQITGQLVKGTASGSQKAVATGSKKIGEKAKGEITVFNITGLPKSFASGAEIITSSGLKFTLDSDIEAASASAPGHASETKVNATAQEVGPKYNLEGGQQFSFTQEDQYSYWAQNNAPFSGGAERQATVVTQDDLNKLEKSLLDGLSQKAKEDLKNQAGGETLHDQAIEVQIKKTNFDKGLDEEASLINLDMEVEASALVYNQDDLKKLLSEIFAQDAPENLQLLPENIAFSDLEIERQKNTMSIAGKMKAKLVPKFDQQDLKEKIKGKSIKDARAQIKNIGEVSEVEVNFKPNIPIVGSIPRNTEKISFQIETI